MISKGPQYQVLSASMVKQLAREQNDVGYGRLCRRYTSHLHTVYNLIKSTINISRVKSLEGHQNNQDVRVVWKEQSLGIISDKSLPC